MVNKVQVVPPLPLVSFKYVLPLFIVSEQPVLDLVYRVVASLIDFLYDCVVSFVLVVCFVDLLAIAVPPLDCDHVVAEDGGPAVGLTLLIAHQLPVQFIEELFDLLLFEHYLFVVGEELAEKLEDSDQRRHVSIVPKLQAVE